MAQKLLKTGSPSRHSRNRESVTKLDKAMSRFIPDEYDRKARWIPGLVSLLPLAVFLYGLPCWNALGPFLYLFASKTFLLFGGMFLLEVLIRRMSKSCIEKILFNHDLAFPATEFLLHANNEFSPKTKERIREKIKIDFGIKLPSAQAERKDENDARKRISEAVCLIRKNMDKGRRLLDYNISYGFWRNMLGVAIVSSVTATACAALAFLYFRISWMGWTELGFATVSVIVLLFRRPLLLGPAKDYAKSLLTEYLATKFERTAP